MLGNVQDVQMTAEGCRQLACLTESSKRSFGEINRHEDSAQSRHDVWPLEMST
jgi:hypothetical protein